MKEEEKEKSFPSKRVKLNEPLDDQDERCEFATKIILGI